MDMLLEDAFVVTMGTGAEPGGPGWSLLVRDGRIAAAGPGARSARRPGRTPPWSGWTARPCCPG